MAQEEVFFVNIYPTNDRRAPLDHHKLLSEIIEHSRSSGIGHTLLTVGDKRLDPMVLAQAGMARDKTFSPVIAINPLYVHPVETAKKLATLASLYPNTISVNLVTGSFFNEMKSIGDQLSLDERSERLIDFFNCLKLLLEGKPARYQSRFYQLNGTEVYPKVSHGTFKYFVSGLLAPKLQGDESVFYLKNIKPLDDQTKSEFPNSGLALGLCVRRTREEALEAVAQLYPVDRRGEMLFSIAQMNQETPWNQWLKVNAEKYRDNPDYYLGPMKNYWSAAPFIVDSYEGAARTLKAYASLGYTFFVLDYRVVEGSHVGEALNLFRS